MFIETSLLFFVLFYPFNISLPNSLCGILFAINLFMKNQICRFVNTNVLVPIIDLFFPPVCYICNVDLSEGRKIICAKCWSEIPPFGGTLDKSLRSRSFDNLLVLFEFEDKIRQLIHLLKYKHHLTLADYFAAEAILRFSRLNKQVYTEIIPVPLYKTRMRERGYNQSEEIAKALAKTIQIPVKSEHLLRIRPTSTQTKMNREDRERNVKNAFFCPSKLYHNNILLVDDVITTGSTIEACVKTLKEAGANSVDVFEIAHPSMKNQ